MHSKRFMPIVVVPVGTTIAVVPSIVGSSSAAAATFEPATCTEPTSGIVECVLPDVQALPEFTLRTLLTEAQAVDSDVSASTPMVITAFGAAGHGGVFAFGDATYLGGLSRPDQAPDR